MITFIKASRIIYNYYTMNKSKESGSVAIIIGIIVVLAIIGVILYMNRAGLSPSGTATSTPSATTVNINTGTQQNPGGPISAPQAGAPIVITSPNAAPSTKSAVVSGSIVPDGSPTSFWFEYGPSPDLGMKASSQAIGSGFNTITTSEFLTGLSVDTTYYYRLVGQNAFGKVTGTTYTFQTSANNPPPPVGSAPSIKTLSASALSRSSATLNGEINPDQSQTQYWFEYGKTSSLGSTSIFQSAGNGNVNAAISATVSNLDPASTYFYRLNAQNQFGTVNGQVMTFVTPGPPVTAAPTAETQSASSIRSSSATLNGSVNPNGIETSYWFEYSSDASLTAPNLKSTSPQSAGSGAALKSVSQGTTGLASSTTYYFRIVAKNSAGLVDGPQSSFKTAATNSR